MWRGVSIKVLLNPKFLVSALTIMVVVINLMKLIIKQIPELNEVLKHIMIYTPSAILITLLALVWDKKEIK